MPLPKEIQDKVDEALRLDTEIFNTLKDKIGEPKAVLVGEVANVVAMARLFPPLRGPAECLLSATIDALGLDQRETVLWITDAVMRRTVTGVVGGKPSG